MRSAVLAAVPVALLAACAGRTPPIERRAESAPTSALAGFGAPFTARPPADGPVKVGPATGTVIVVGGGAMGPEIYQAFIDAAGGPDGLILDVPNAGGTDTVPRTAGQPWRAHGATRVAVLFTRDRRVAESEAFTAIIKQAGGVWFEGGRQFHLVQDYGGTRTERELRAVLARGGVVGGSSAGASVLGDFMVRGAPSNDNTVMDAPGYERGFGYLHNVGIDQHVVARSRLPDLADSIIPRYPTLLGLSADEGTAWVVRGDTGRILGRGQAFVYNGRDATDPGSPFLTLHPGDRYDLHTRRVLSRASDRSPVRRALIDTLFAKYQDPAAGGATVLVARDGAVFVDRAFGIPPQARYMPRTTLPQFDVGDIARTFLALCEQLPPAPARGQGPPDSAPPSGAVGTSGGRGARGGPRASALQTCVTRVSTPVGAHQTVAVDSAHVRSSVDELYRFALGFEVPTTWPNVDPAKGWTADTYQGVTRFAAYATPDGRRAAFLRVPARHATIIVLTNDATADARGIAERICDQLFAPQ